MRSPDPGRSLAATLEVRGLEVCLGGRTVLRGVDLTAAPGELVGIVGPNGSGKSTLLRGVGRLAQPRAGVVRIDGEDVWAMSPRESARRQAIVLQDHPADVDLTVSEMVALGRLAHRGSGDGRIRDDGQIVAAALADAGVVGLADRLFPTLSGGERQRVLIARSLAQQARVMLLDEPTNHLDIRAQLDLMDMIRQLPVTTVCVLHDLDHAAALCDRLYLMDRGRVVAHGPPGQVLTPERVRDVFGVRLMTAHVDGGPRPHLVFESLRRTEEDDG